MQIELTINELTRVVNQLDSAGGVCNVMADEGKKVSLTVDNVLYEFKAYWNQLSKPDWICISHDIVLHNNENKRDLSII